MAVTNTSKVTKLLRKIFGKDVELTCICVTDAFVDFDVRGTVPWVEGSLLKTLILIRDTFDAEDVDMPSHYHAQGCETCDYGAFDVYSFHVTGINKHKLLC